MTTSYQPRGSLDRQPTRPSKPPQYAQFGNHSTNDLSSSSSSSSAVPRQRYPIVPAGFPVPPLDSSAYPPPQPPPSAPPPPLPPKVGGVRMPSNGSQQQYYYSQKVRDSGSNPPTPIVAELEGDFAMMNMGNISSSAGEGAKKVKKSSGKKAKRTEADAAEEWAQQLVEQSRAPPQKRKLRVLSLDGGGIRGYSSLVILGDLMHRVHRLVNNNVPVAPHQLPRPCDFFDIIGGNGTGGLIALMLGRMRMDVETCKEYYEALTRYVFYTDKTILGMPYGNTLFKASRLEEAIKICVRESTRYDHLPLLPYVPMAQNDGQTPPTLPTVEPASTMRKGSLVSRTGSWPKKARNDSMGSQTKNEYGNQSTFSSFSSNSTMNGADSNRYSSGSSEPKFMLKGRSYNSNMDQMLGNPDTPLLDHRVGACKTFVTCSYQSAGRGVPPVLLRSYRTARDPISTVSDKCTIWQAGRATSATRSAFKPITIANVTFLDEGFGKYNPALYVLEEALARETWHDVDGVLVDDHSPPEIGLFVSVGTGKRAGGSDDGHGPHKPHGLKKDKPLWWESMGMLEQYSEAKKRLMEKLEDCETVDRTMSMKGGELEKRGVDRSNYYRFNVEVGVGEFGMNEWNRLADVSTNTRTYLARTDVEGNMKQCAEKLVDIWGDIERMKNPPPPPPKVAAAPMVEEKQVIPELNEEELRRKKERAKRRAEKVEAAAAAAAAAGRPSPPSQSPMVVELEADIDRATSEWQSHHKAGSFPNSGRTSSEDESHHYQQPQYRQPRPPQQQQQYYSNPSQSNTVSPPPSRGNVVSPPPSRGNMYNPPPVLPARGGSRPSTANSATAPPPVILNQPAAPAPPPPPAAPASKMTSPPPDDIARWVRQLPQRAHEPPIPIPSPGDFLPRIVTTAPAASGADANAVEDYFGLGVDSDGNSMIAGVTPPEIRVTSPTTVAGDETPPGTPRPGQQGRRSIEGDRQARREKRERRERERREREAGRR